MRLKPQSMKAPPTKRKARRTEYFKIQTQWKRNRSGCLRSLLKDKKSASIPPQDVMTRFCKQVMTTSHTTTPGVQQQHEVKTDLWISISPKEVRRALPSLGTSPGPDGITANNHRAVPIGILTRISNIFMICGRLPEHLLESRTTLIPKKDEASSPGDLRLITVFSVITRTFHKIQANRLNRHINLDYKQKAFRPIDASSEKVFLMYLALRHARHTFTPMFMASFDVAKAFDSVTHSTIADTFTSIGVPSLMVKYISNTYERSTTRLKCGEWTSHKIRPTCGVKQGDLLYP